MNDYKNYTQRDKKQMHYSPNLINVIQNAIDNRLLASIEYDSREKGITERNVEPFALVYKEGKRNLVGFCHLRNEYRSFRLDRLNLVKLRKETFDFRPDFNADDFGDTNESNGNENYESDY